MLGQTPSFHMLRSWMRVVVCATTRGPLFVIDRASNLIVLGVFLLLPL